MATFPRVLITGTTSGLGAAFKEYYEKSGSAVLAVNRRQTQGGGAANERIVDITDYGAVRTFLKELEANGQVPDLMILNAGINRPDNISGLNFPIFREVMRTNLDGVMTFVGAAHELGWKGKTFFSLSSTSNIVPNPAHLSYFLSKGNLLEAFRIFRKKDPANEYKCIILGPVATNIMAGYSGPVGLQKRIYNFLCIQPKDAAEACGRFLASNRKELRYTWLACTFYSAVRFLLRFVPSLYRGTTEAQSA